MDPVDLGFGRSQALEDGSGPLLDWGGQRAGSDEFLDLVPGARLRGEARLIKRDGDLGTGNRPPLRWLSGYPVAGQG